MLPLADLFQALADPTRLRILALLRSMELSVGELAQVLGQSQPRVSRHVKILADAGLVERRKEGSWVFLALAEPDRDRADVRAARLLGRRADARRCSSADAARLEAVRADRAEAAARYFAAHAATWDSIRSLHVAESEVEQAIDRALGDRPLGRLVDIGTGTGRMIELFGPRAEQAIGIDRSSEMLRLARVKLEAAGIAVEPSPGRHVRAAAGRRQRRQRHHPPGAALCPLAGRGDRRGGARAARPAGRLLVVDFAPHEREELRDQRRPPPPRLRRRGDGRLVRRAPGWPSTVSSISRAAS